MTWVSIHPRDVWLFRDGKPFTAGEDNRARSMFPPTPLTVQGALRHKISATSGLSYREYKAGASDLAQTVGQLIGTHEAQKDGLDTGAFQMAGPFIGYQQQGDSILPLFPSPADLLKHDKTNEFMITAPQDAAITSDLGDTYQFLKVRRDYENLSGFWLTGDLFANYLDDTAPDAKFYLDPEADDPLLKNIKSVKQALAANKRIFSSSIVYQNENRFGVSTNSLTSFREEGQLYQAQFVRPADGICLFANVTGDHDNGLIPGTISLGGEQRQARLDLANVANFPQIPSDKPEPPKRFKIIFLTPAYFAEGWLPTNKDWSEWFGENVTLKSAALYRPTRIGGWNSAGGKNGAPRAMHNYVTPGSVYYFEASGDYQQPTAISESPPRINDAAQIGFGQVAYSTW